MQMSDTELVQMSDNQLVQMSDNQLVQMSDNLLVQMSDKLLVQMYTDQSYQGPGSTLSSASEGSIFCLVSLSSWFISSF
jgi:hypothetical protein